MTHVWREAWPSACAPQPSSNVEAAVGVDKARWGSCIVVSMPTRRDKGRRREIRSRPTQGRRRAVRERGSAMRGAQQQGTRQSGYKNMQATVLALAALQGQQLEPRARCLQQVEAARYVDENNTDWRVACLARQSGEHGAAYSCTLAHAGVHHCPVRRGNQGGRSARQTTRRQTRREMVGCGV